MPKVSKDTATETIALDGLEGKVAFRLPGGAETYVAGDAYYVPPGHTPVHYAGAEIVEFSATDALTQTIPVVLENLNARSRA